MRFVIFAHFSPSIPPRGVVAISPLFHFRRKGKYRLLEQRRKFPPNTFLEVRIHITITKLLLTSTLRSSSSKCLKSSMVFNGRETCFSKTEFRLSLTLLLKSATDCRLCKSLFRSRFSDFSALYIRHFISATILAIVRWYLF